MVYSRWARVCPEEEVQWQAYKDKIDNASVEELVKELFSYLDYTEIRGQEDREVRPISVSCGRVLMQEPLSYVLKTLRQKV